MPQIRFRNETCEPVEVVLKRTGSDPHRATVAPGQETDFGFDTGWHDDWTVAVGEPGKRARHRLRKLARDSVVTCSKTGRGKIRLDAARPANMGTATIDHVVVLMLENRSFDNILGWMYDGRDTSKLNYVPKHSSGTPFMGLSKDTYWNDTSGGERVYASKGTTGDGGSRWAVPDPDPQEQFRFMNQQQFSTLNPKPGATPAMKGFVVDYETVADNPAPNQIMQSYAPDQVPVLTALARAYAVSDRWFASAPCQTWPNRSFVHAGTSNGRINNLDGPVDSNQLPSPKYYDIPTVFEFLERLGVPWGVFSGVFSLTRYQFSKRFDQLKYLFGKFWPLFIFKLKAKWGKLPAYSFIEPTRWVFDTNDQHPPHDIRPAEKLIHEVYQAVSSGKKWDNTLLVITYDEHGGCFDHVPPPTAAKPDNAKPQQPPVSGVRPFDFKRYGVRVPTVLISPFIKAGTVIRSACPDVEYDHTSILATLRDWIDPKCARFDAVLPSKRIRKAPTLAPVFTLKKARRTLPKIPEPVDQGWLRPRPDTKLNPVQVAAVGSALARLQGKKPDANILRRLDVSTIGEARKALGRRRKL